MLFDLDTGRKLPPDRNFRAIEKVYAGTTDRTAVD